MNSATADARPEPVSARTHWAPAVLILVYAMSLIDRQIMGVLIEPVKALKQGETRR